MHKEREEQSRSEAEPDPSGHVKRRRAKKDLEAGGESLSTKERKAFQDDVKMSSISGEVGLLTTIKDVEDELHIMAMLFEDQRGVLDVLEKAVRISRRPPAQPPAQSPASQLMELVCVEYEWGEAPQGSYPGAVSRLSLLLKVHLLKFYPLRLGVSPCSSLPIPKSSRASTSHVNRPRDPRDWANVRRGPDLSPSRSA